MQKGTKRLNKGFDVLSMLQSFFLLIYCLELVLPVVTSFGGSNYISFICFVFWLGIAVIRDPKFINNLPFSYVILLAVYVLTSVLPCLYGHIDIAHGHISFTAVFGGPFIYKYYDDSGELKTLGKILMVMIAVSFITAFTTLIGLIRNPWASRLINGNAASDVLLYRQNIGGYHFVYYFTGLSLVFLFLAFAEKRKLHRFFYALCFCFSSFTVAKTGFMTALLAMLIGAIYLVLSFCFNGKNMGLKIIAAIGVISCLAMFAGELIPLLPERIARVFASGESSAFKSLLNEFLGDRWPVMMSSIQGFFQHPLLGILSGGDSYFGGSFYQGFGQHSFFLDTLALYGLPIGLATVVCLISATRHQRKKGTAKKLGKALSIYMIVMFLFNVATNSIGFVIFVVGPYVQTIISKEESHEIAYAYRKVPVQLRKTH